MKGTRDSRVAGALGYEGQVLRSEESYMGPNTAASIYIVSG